MCGRARCSLSREEVRAQANVDRWNDEAAYEPGFNLSPGKSTPVLKQGTVSSGRELHTMRWGLVPSYTKPDDTPDFFRMFNARSETVAEKGVFSKLLSRQRCIVFMNGFYEWKKEGTQKQPYFIYREGQSALHMAGLYDVWKGSSEELMYSYTILTTDSSEKLTWLHDRMPVILRDHSAVDAWLSDTSPQAPGGISSLCTPYNEGDLQWFPVDPKMNSSRVDGPEVCQPLKRRPITSFFKVAGVKKEQPSPSVRAAEGQLSTKPEPEGSGQIPRAPDGAEVAAGDIQSLAEEEGRATKTEPGISVTERSQEPGISEVKKEVDHSSTGNFEADVKSQNSGKTVDAGDSQWQSPTALQSSLHEKRGVKRPGSQQSQHRGVKSKSAEKGKITSFFTKNPA